MLRATRVRRGPVTSAVVVYESVTGQGPAVGEDPDDIGAPADFLVQPFLGIVGPDPPSDFTGERGARRQVRTGLVQVGGGLGELGLEGVDDLPGPGVDRGGVGLFEDGARCPSHTCGSRCAGWSAPG